MAKTDIKIYATEAASGKKTTTSITYVNPEADSQTLKTFAQMMNAFTTNNYVETDRIHTINVDTEQVTTIQQGTLELVTNPTITKNGTTNFDIALNQFIINGQVRDNTSEYNFIFGYFTQNDGVKRVAYNDTGAVRILNSEAGKTGTLHLALKPEGNYTAAVLDQEITLPS